MVILKAISAKTEPANKPSTHICKINPYFHFFNKALRYSNVGGSVFARSTHICYLHFLSLALRYEVRGPYFGDRKARLRFSLVHTRGAPLLVWAIRPTSEQRAFKRTTAFISTVNQPFASLRHSKTLIPSA